MRIVLLEPLSISEEKLNELAQPLKDDGNEFIAYPDKTSDEDELVSRARGAEIVMIANNPLPDSVITQLPQLKYIAVAFTGIDHVGLNACRKQHIVVSNCAGYSDTSVAELTVGLTLDVLRKVLLGDIAARTGKTSAGLVGQEITGKTVGLIGTGHIGSAVAKLFTALGATVLGYARHTSQTAIDAGVTFVSEEELLKQSDIVSLHLPLNDQTKKSFGAAQFAQMKDGAVFINCARGAIVDNEALAYALRSGKLAGAGVDVFDVEPPLPADYPLLHAPNLVLTPHVGFLTKEGLERRAQIEFDNVQNYLAGRPTNVCEL